MRKLLIVTASEELRLALTNTLKSKYDLLVCGDTETAGQLLDETPDGMILDLHMQGVDCLTFLEDTVHRHPPVTLALTWLLSPYLEQALNDLHIGYILRLPVSLSAIEWRLEDMFRKLDAADSAQKEAHLRYHLQRLGLRSDRVGYLRLVSSILLFSEDPQRTLFSDIYPVIAQETGSNCTAIDNAIHDLIKSAWEHRNPEIWRMYFPQETKCPKNKHFIAVLADYV